MREVKRKAVERKIFLELPRVFASLFVFAFLLVPAAARAQSSDQNFPVHVTRPEINGVIKARSMGDARLTTYFFLFKGEQGDVFVHVATTNFSGDIDVYMADSMKPLTKMVMYADNGLSETGRLIYLRQPARLLLRIEGRTPNDDPATFRIKFAGSFVALEAETYEPPPMVKSRESVESAESREAKTENQKTEAQSPEAERSVSEDPKPKTDKPDPETVYENKSAKVTVKSAAKPTTAKRRAATSVKEVSPSTGVSSEKSAAGRKPKTKTSKAKTDTTQPPPPPDPLANVKLVVALKDGTVVERPMTDVSRFSFDKGRLTVVEKNGAITRYQITDIVRVTIE